MDWSNETYVRLYTRDTTSWRRLGWNGQSALMQLLRKVDRAGTLDIDGLEPWEALVLHCQAPEDAAREGMAALLRVGVVVLRGSRLVFPNFLEAQECSKSDKLRAKEYRERRAKEPGDSTPAQSEESQGVMAPSQDVTLPSQPITPRHDESRSVTPRHSLLCLPLLSNAVHTEIMSPSAPAAVAASVPGEVVSLPAKPRKTDEAKAALSAAITESFRASNELRPVVTGKPLANAAGSVRELVKLGKAPDLAAAARMLVEAARRSGKDWPWCLHDPFARPGSAAGRQGRPTMAPATTDKDFEGAMPWEEQMARLERVK
jgi:hypothetical protein